MFIFVEIEDRLGVVRNWKGGEEVKIERLTIVYKMQEAKRCGIL